MSNFKTFSKRLFTNTTHIVVGMMAIFFFFPNANALMSKDGVIQNVQNYSSNPFWQTGTNSYNQRMPTAVYATGTAIETSECQSIVATLVATQCAQLNNCISSQLSDIRPAIMLQLSRIPNGNYATACAGYIDTAFDSFIKTRGNAAPMYQASFPAATTPNPIASQPTAMPENPYKKKTPDWQSDIMERKLELQQLQAANGATTPKLQAASFPTTASDLSFEQRISNAQQGYEPYFGKSAYHQIEIENKEEYLKRKANYEKQYAQNQANYCARNTVTYQTWISDLETLRNCQLNNANFSDCKLKGTY